MLKEGARAQPVSVITGTSAKDPIRLRFEIELLTIGVMALSSEQEFAIHPLCEMRDSIFASTPACVRIRLLIGPAPARLRCDNVEQTSKPKIVRFQSGCVEFVRRYQQGGRRLLLAQGRFDFGIGAPHLIGYLIVQRLNSRSHSRLLCFCCRKGVLTPPSIKQSLLQVELHGPGPSPRRLEPIEISLPVVPLHPA
jgi:hypothetical protein